jgi:hypothetical protein
VLYVTDHRINPDELTLLDDMVPSREAAAPARWRAAGA